jgi:hypothetical protein
MTEIRDPRTGETYTIDDAKASKRLGLRCGSPSERAEVARRIRAHAALLGVKVLVETRGAFALTVEANEDILAVLFEKELS